MTVEKKNYSTIYDDVFRTIVEKLPCLLIPVINEVFQTNYAKHEKIAVLHNEHHSRDGELITDSCLLIGRHLYHIECQSWPDARMEIRMIEYDFLIALENAQKVDGVYEMEFPRSCTLYLRHTENTPDFLTVRLVIPDAREPQRVKKVTYETPIIKVQNYSKSEIFEKDLVAFLPYYIMRYEKELPEIRSDNGKLQKLLDEYESIRDLLSEELQGEERASVYADLVSLIVKISEYFLESNSEARKGVTEIMRGRVLELESERLHAEGFAEGHEEGRAEGHAEGMTEALVQLVKDGLLEVSIAAERAKMSEEEFLALVNGMKK